MSLTGAAKLACVIGWPVKHSLSPRLHNYWLRQRELDGLYIPLEIAPEDLKGALEFMEKTGFRGANFTVPHKEAVMEYCAGVDETVRATGAANTIWHQRDGWHATNTDVYGLRMHLGQTLGTEALRGKRVVVLGAGGAARAVMLALEQLGIASARIINRHPGRAEAVAAQFATVRSVHGWEKPAPILAEGDVLINTTVLGMKGKDPLFLDLSSLPEHAVVVDIVYNPLETDLLRQARLRRLTTVDGLGMLLHQAVDGFARWFGVRPEVDDATRAHVLAGLI